MKYTQQYKTSVFCLYKTSSILTSIHLKIQSTGRMRVANVQMCFQYISMNVKIQDIDTSMYKCIILR